MGALDVVVAVPRPVIKLHESHAFFDELTGQEAFTAERVRRILADSIEFLGLLVLFRKVERLRHLHLHPEGQLVVVHTRGQLVMSGVLLGVGGIELGH